MCKKLILNYYLTKLKDTIQTYFDGGEDPFGTEKKYIGLSQLEWLEQLEEK